MYMTTLPVAAVRAQLSRLIVRPPPRTNASRSPATGAAPQSCSRPTYDILQDTLAVLSDAELMAAHHEGPAAIEAGNHLDAAELANAMREAGRLPW